jgi:hypothetical protein
VALVDRFRGIERELPDDWETAHLILVLQDDKDAARAAALLSPLQPGRRGTVINFTATQRGGGFGADRVASLLRRIDRERIAGQLALGGATAMTETTSVATQSLAAAWDEAVAGLPPDWSDAFVEASLSSTDYIEPGALRLSPLNPRRSGPTPVFRFRVARRFGYGGSPEMARRCFERLDEAGITGTLRIVNALSDTKPARTQGPVLYTAGGPT